MKLRFNIQEDAYVQRRLHTECGTSYSDDAQSLIFADRVIRDAGEFDQSLAHIVPILKIPM